MFKKLFNSLCNHNHNDEFMVYWVGLEFGLGDDVCRSVCISECQHSANSRGYLHNPETVSAINKLSLLLDQE